MLTHRGISDATLRNAKILIIDDEANHVRVLESLLRSERFVNLHSTTDPRVAAELCSAVGPDLVILDHMMPHVSGLEVLKAIRASFPEESFLPVLMMTGDVRIETKRTALAAGATDFVLKPFDSVEIVLRVVHLLQTRLLQTRLEENVRRNAQFAAALMNTSAGVVLTDPALPGNPIVFANEGFSALTGYSVEEVTGRNCRFLQGAETDPGTIEKIRESIAARRTFRGEVLNYRKDGTPFWNDLIISPVYDPEGRLINFVGLQTDVSGRIHATAAVAESERRLHAFIENAPWPVYMKDTDGRYILANRKCDEVMGLAKGQISGRTDAEVFPAVISNTIMAQDRKVFETRSSLEAEDEFPGPQGSEWFATVKFPLLDAEGKPYAICGISNDITQRKHSEAALIRAKEDAERANRAKSDFLSRMSHELRTPLNSILGFGQLLEMDEHLTSDNQRSVEQILRGGRHLLQLINEVLDIARIESGKMALSVEAVDAVEVLDEALRLIAPIAGKAGIHVEHTLETCHLYLLADRQRIRQVLLNLLSNAVKYNRAFGSVMVSCGECQPGWVRIEVRDKGNGISPEDLPRLFTAFERLGADRRGIEGVGIGLALSKRLVELMGGRIGAESVVGEGSTFWIELPCTGNPVERLDAAGDEFPELTAPRRHRHTLLYIEDNLSNLTLIERLVARQPAVCLLAAMQGELGLQMAREHQPDLIVLDLHLPDINGDEVLLRLQSDAATRNIPVVMLSADATPGQIDRLLSAGAREYLTKPLDVPKFLRVLSAILEPESAS